MEKKIYNQPYTEFVDLNLETVMQGGGDIIEPGSEQDFANRSETELQVEEDSQDAIPKSLWEE